MRCTILIITCASMLLGCSTKTHETDEGDAAEEKPDLGVADARPPGGPDALPLLETAGDELHLRPRQRARLTLASSTDHLRSGLYYFRHSAEAAQVYTSRSHRVTRSIDVNWPLEVSRCLHPTHCARLLPPEPASESYRARLQDANNPLHQEIANLSESIVVHFGNMPRWLSACAEKNAADPSVCETAGGCGNYVYNLYPPNDWVAWKDVVEETIDVLLELTEREAGPRTVYLEIWNEPDAPCYWRDTKESFLDFYRRTSVAFSQTLPLVCARKSFTPERCERLRFGGPAAARWNDDIGGAGPKSLSEDLIRFALQEARLDPAVRLDFISWHGFWGSSAGGPRSALALARDRFVAEYASEAGADPPFPPPELLVTEWNASDAERASVRHPVILAEAFMGFAENDLRLAMIASLDQQKRPSSLGDGDFGLLVTDPRTEHFARPAFYVYHAMAGFSETTTSYGYEVRDDARLFMSEARLEDGLSCTNLVLWEFVPDPLVAALEVLVAPGRIDPAMLSASYASAPEPAVLPTACEPYRERLTSVGSRALCADIALGVCATIPSPVPPGGHACDGEWATFFAEARLRFESLAHLVSTPAVVNIHDFGGAVAAQRWRAAVVREDHEAPEPVSPPGALSADGRTLSISLNRNEVLFMRDVCVVP